MQNEIYFTNSFLSKGYCLFCLDFVSCKFTKHPYEIQQSLKSFGCLKQRTMSSEIGIAWLTPFNFVFIYLFIYLSPSGSAKTARTKLNSSSDSGYPCLVLYLSGNAFNFLPFNMILALCFSYIAFIMLRKELKELSIVNLLKLFFCHIRICYQMLFLHLSRELCGSYSSVCSYDVSCLLIFICCTISEKLE